MAPSWFVGLFGPLILWLDARVRGPDALWRHPLATLADMGNWMGSGSNGLVLGGALLAMALWLVLRRRK